MTSDQSYTQAFEEHYPSVLAFARRRMGQTQGEEIAAETFTVAWRRWDDAPEDPRPWLFGIAKNVIREQVRKGHSQGRLVEQLKMTTVLATKDPVDDALTSVDLRTAWMMLSASDREVIALVAWDGLTGKQAAQVLSISRVAYAARLSRARARLRRHLGQNDWKIEEQQ